MSTVNVQPIEKTVEDVDTLEIHSIFHTIQGEGPFCGRPAVFVRLAGCNLQCPMCDTDYTSIRKTMTAREILNVIIRLPIHDNGLIVVTGGEPFRQPVGLGKLFTLLWQEGFAVQVETNGTLPPPLTIAPYWITYQNERSPGQGIYIVVSPKTGKINTECWARACALKYVIDVNNVNKDDGLPTKALGHSANPQLARPPRGWNKPIYIQPADVQDELNNQRNTDAAVSSAMRFGYTVQVQTHKILGLE